MASAFTFRLDWGYERLDGSTEQSEREKRLHVCVNSLTRPAPGMPMIDRFHGDPDTWIFLISTLAGGTGLNLVGANKVVIFGELPNSSLACPSSPFEQIQTGVSAFTSLLGHFEINQVLNVNVHRSGS
jgi:hypothetical protein